MQIVEIEPEMTVAFHYHKTSLEVFHMLDGTGSMTIGGVEHRLSPGDTIMCEPLEVHNACNESDEVWRFIVFKTNVTEDDLYWVEE